MFTGDNRKNAERIGKELGIQNIKSEMLPQDKYNELEKINSHKYSLYILQMCSFSKCINYIK